MTIKTNEETLEEMERSAIAASFAEEEEKEDEDEDGDSMDEEMRRRESVMRSKSFFRENKEDKSQRHVRLLGAWSFVDVEETLDFSMRHYDLTVVIQFNTGEQVELRIDQYDAVRGVMSRQFDVSSTEGHRTNYECSQVVTEDNVNCFNIYERVDLDKWMARCGGSALLSSLNIPGTHDSGAYRSSSGLDAQMMAKCQSRDIREQLDNGVRYLDIRCKHVSDRFEIYHGVISQALSFDDVLGQVTGFLQRNPTESVIFAVKQEGQRKGKCTRCFAETFLWYADRWNMNNWYLGDVIPTLRRVRGKMVLVRRFSVERLPPRQQKLGLDLSMWTSNNDTIEQLEPDRFMYHIQDVYRTNNQDKIEQIRASFHLAREAERENCLVINMLSKSDIPVTPLTLAKQINVRFNVFLTLQQNGTKVRTGIIVMDFCEIPGKFMPCSIREYTACAFDGNFYVECGIKQIISNNHFTGPLERTYVIYISSVYLVSNITRQL